MTDPILIATVAASTLSASGIAAWAGLKGWHGWLELRRTELDVRGGGGRKGGRREVSELRERVRRLEAIASGADL